MNAHARLTFWIEAALAGLSCLLCLLTLLWRDWVEAILRVDPDHGSGVVEWGIVAALMTLSSIFAVLARLEWRRLVLSR